ncbi:hypothetical protein BDN71DRAFT_1456032 [Pleurotus eryngii]|uniref:Uncharacterized protein n=1 Tax=Pleurotus eryngii TaxID=5323 RepID=A0A9P6DA94_PLEER|nr:hypothetical protein BDN71DRAFT_1456032 [Pleurotus eryngii]
MAVGYLDRWNLESTTAIVNRCSGRRHPMPQPPARDSSGQIRSTLTPPSPIATRTSQNTRRRRYLLQE